MKNTIICIAVTLLFLISSATVAAFNEKIKIAVFPFNNLQLQSLDMNIADVLRSELLQHTFIETVPVEVVRQKLFDMEPSLMWTGEEGGIREGGILWKIDTKVIESVNYTGFADYYIFGDYGEFRNKWSISAYIYENTASQPDETFILHGTTDDELSGKLKELAERIYRWLNKKYALHQAEDIVRDYMGNIFGYDTAVVKMASIVKENPGSIPLHALLLDLYLQDKDHRDKAVNEALRVIDMYDPSHANDVRYILSLSLDPFDVVALKYESGMKWSKVIEIRLRALEGFPSNMSVHKNRLGEAYYFNALLSEEKGSKEEAYINYGNALRYLNASSEYYGPAVKGYNEGEQQ